MIVNSNSLNTLMRNQILSIPMVQMLLRSTLNLSDFSFLKNVEIEFKITLQIFFSLRICPNCLQKLDFS